MSQCEIQQEYTGEVCQEVLTIWRLCYTPTVNEIPIPSTTRQQEAEDMAKTIM